jgi:predicted nucleic acid-binding protein
VIVVSDTSPLNYLVLIKQEGVLPMLFKEIVTTPEVLEELRVPRTPQIVRAWVETPPQWLAVRAAHSIDPSLQLGKGETSAISLASELQRERSDVTLLIDERDGRAAARLRGLRTAGTLAVISEAARADLLDLPLAIEDLRRTSFHVKPAVLEELLRLYREERP